MTNAQSAGIRYPKRADDISKFEDYRVFPEFWESILEPMREAMRLMRANRGAVHILGIYGEKGAGKTLFAKQLLRDYEAAKKTPPGEGLPSSNVWQSVAKQPHDTSEGLAQVTASTKVVQLDHEDQRQWVDLVEGYAEHQVPSVIVLDNAERVQFLRGLGMSDAATRGSVDDRLKLVSEAGEILVEASRVHFRDTLLVILSNNRDFLAKLGESIADGEEDLWSFAEINLPTSAEKEKAVRINVNRLNGTSYWSCLDRATSERRRDVQDNITNSTTFPAAFGAVDKAFASSLGKARPGRPGRKNQLNLIVVTNEDAIGTSHRKLLATNASDTTYRLEYSDPAHPWIQSEMMQSGWASAVKEGRRRRLLESEWQLRLVLLGNRFAASLFRFDLLASAEAQEVTELLGLMTRPMGPTFADPASRKPWQEAVSRTAGGWTSPSTEDADAGAFWGARMGRSLNYENALSAVLIGYNRTATGFGNKRPDWVVTDYAPCSIIDGDEASRFKREANFAEITTLGQTTRASLNAYLKDKLPNYVDALENN